MCRHHRTHAVRAHLLELAGDTEAAAAGYRTARRLTTSLPEQRYLNRRLAALGPPTSAKPLSGPNPS
jgi:predicted RNA polymerase sigma factor